MTNSTTQASCSQVKEDPGLSKATDAQQGKLCGPKRETTGESILNELTHDIVKSNQRPNPTGLMDITIDVKR